MTDLHHTIAQHIVRRLEEATSFSGKLNCSFDASMPLNLTDLKQPFLMTCKTPPSPGMPGWVVALIVIGTLLSPFIIFCIGGVIYVCVSACIDSCREFRRRKRLAAAEDAKNDFVKA